MLSSPKNMKASNITISSSSSCCSACFSSHLPRNSSTGPPAPPCRPLAQPKLTTSSAHLEHWAACRNNPVRMICLLQRKIRVQTLCRPTDQAAAPLLALLASRPVVQRLFPRSIHPPLLIRPLRPILQSTTPHLSPLLAAPHQTPVIFCPPPPYFRLGNARSSWVLHQHLTVR
jgi:hypothetical protein